jgi:hypothetical protein
MMSLAEFETQTAPLAQSTQRLQALDAQYAAELNAREEADAAARETMRLVAHAVRGNPKAAGPRKQDAPPAKQDAPDESGESLGVFGDSPHRSGESHHGSGESPDL